MRTLAACILLLACTNVMAVGSSLRPAAATPSTPTAKPDVPGAPAKPAQPAVDVQRENAACRSTETACKAQCAKIAPDKTATPPTAARDACTAHCATDVAQCLDAVKKKAGQ